MLVGLMQSAVSVYEEHAEHSVQLLSEASCQWRNAGCSFSWEMGQVERTMSVLWSSSPCCQTNDDLIDTWYPYFQTKAANHVIVCTNIHVNIWFFFAQKIRSSQVQICLSFCVFALNLCRVKVWFCKTANYAIRDSDWLLSRLCEWSRAYKVQVRHLQVQDRIKILICCSGNTNQE